MSHRFEWISGPVVLGAVLLLLIVPHLALVALVWVISLAAVVALAALAGGDAGEPNLLFRPLRRRLARPVTADERDLDHPRERA